MAARQLLTDESRARVLRFLERARTPEGAYRARGGRPDLYYTVFGLGASAALGDRSLFTDATLPACLGDGWQPGELDFIHLVSLLRCWRYRPEATGGGTSAVPKISPGRLIDALRAYRSRDGGYSHERRGAETGTMYGAFLSEQAFRDAGLSWEAGGALQSGMARWAAADGGFSNHAGARYGTAAATASALILRARYGGLTPESEVGATAFLERLRDPEGGYRATVDAPVADLLSTACVRYAQAACGMQTSPEARQADSRFVESLWSDAGGFRGHASDPLPDVEYTWYALLTLGAMARLRPHGAG